MYDRYDRSVRAWDANPEEGRRRQELLKNTKALVIGSDYLAQMVLSCLAGLGIGNIITIDNKKVSGNDRDFLSPHETFNIGKKKVRYFKETLKKINDDCTITAIASKFARAFTYMHSPDIIIDATNNPISKEEALNFAISYSKPFISCAANEEKGAIACYWPKNESGFKIHKEEPELETLLLNEFSGSKQAGYTSGVIAGIVTEEIRKHKFKYEERDKNIPRNQKLVYNIYSSQKNLKESDIKTKALPYFKQKKALVVGCGALGNFLALNLAILGTCRIDLIDFDTADQTNLNRQILLYGKVGNKKCEILSERIKEIDKQITSDAIYGKIGKVNINKDRIWLEKLYEADKITYEKTATDRRDETFPQSLEQYIKKFFELTKEQENNNVELITPERIKEKNYDIILGGIDNKIARIWLNQFAVENKIPYIDGGTGPRSGQFAVYIPGKTKCVDCQINLMSFPVQHFSCIVQPDPGVVMSNIILGSAMVGEAIHIFYKGLNEEYTPTSFRYDALEEKRIYTTPKRNLVNNHC